MSQLDPTVQRVLDAVRSYCQVLSEFQVNQPHAQDIMATTRRELFSSIKAYDMTTTAPTEESPVKMLSVEEANRLLNFPSEPPKILQEPVKTLRDEMAIEMSGFAWNTEVSEAAKHLQIEQWDSSKEPEAKWWARADAMIKYMKADAMLLERAKQTEGRA